MSKGDLKKQHILGAGLGVMKAQGYNGTSVKDIVEAAGVPKGSFYNYFESKEAFAVAAIEQTSSAELQAVRGMLGDRSRPPLERLVEFFTCQVEDCCQCDFRMGCFLGNMCQEMADSSDLIRNTLRRALQQHTRAVEEVLSEALTQGQLAADTDTRTLAEFLFNAWEGAMMRMKASKSREPLDAFVSQLRWMLGRYAPVEAMES
ncbi:TetR family transcriptional regulator C-terminal domain-containing protein [Gilvimarinus sp. F26214L]|uniref:TetR family transcriptional regulator C-terminal domain-containing protein n=1 Tax=Gilvimarinus sp. DZF01 TaxID=3461371 RepID=UPI004045D0A3